MRRGPGRRKRNPKDDAADAARAKRRAEAWRLRCEKGLTTRQIAAQLGISVGQAHNDLKAVRTAVKPEDADELRAEASETLQLLRDRMFELAVRGDALGAQAAIKAIAEHAKLNGLYAPTKSELSGPNGGPIDVKSAQDELLGRIARIAAGAGTTPRDPKPHG